MDKAESDVRPLFISYASQVFNWEKKSHSSMLSLEPFSLIFFKKYQFHMFHVFFTISPFYKKYRQDMLLQNPGHLTWCVLFAEIFLPRPWYQKQSIELEQMLVFLLLMNLYISSSICIHASDKSSFENIFPPFSLANISSGLSSWELQIFKQSFWPIISTNQNFVILYVKCGLDQAL